jgi:hypothetical protein
MSRALCVMMRLINSGRKIPTLSQGLPPASFMLSSHLQLSHPGLTLPRNQLPDATPPETCRESLSSLPLIGSTINMDTVAG